ncbi:MAG: SIMPL domain-containing protein [Bacillota bacterium]
MNENRLLLAAMACMTALILGAMFLLRPTQQIQVLNNPDAGNFMAMAGTGTVSVKPDTALVTLGFTKQASTAQVAQTEANQAMNAVIEALKAQGIPQEKLQTSSFQIHPEYSYNKEHAPTLIGYRVNSSIRVTSNKPESVGSLIDAAIAAGANQVTSIAFTVRDADKVKEEALGKAVENARQKAEIAAKKLGVTVAGVRRVHVGEPGGPAPMYREEYVKMATMDAGSAMQVQPGELDMKVNVTVEFNLK